VALVIKSENPKKCFVQDSTHDINRHVHALPKTSSLICWIHWYNLLFPSWTSSSLCMREYMAWTIAQDFTMMSPVVAKNCCSKHWYTVCFCCTPAVRCYHLICRLISDPLAISCLWQDWIQLKISSWSLSVWKLGPVNLRFRMLHYSWTLIVFRSDKWSVSLQLLQLLLKASQDDHFVCEEAERTLTGMTTSISPEPMLQKLQPYVSHQNPWVQAKAVMCMDNSVVRLVCPFGILDHNHRLCCKSLGFKSIPSWFIWWFCVHLVMDYALVYL
jgi:hypothetical protein